MGRSYHHEELLLMEETGAAAPLRRPNPRQLVAHGRRASEAKASRNAHSGQKLKTNTSRHLEGSPKRNEIATPACHSRGIVIVAERSLVAVTGAGRCRNGRESSNHKHHRDL